MRGIWALTIVALGCLGCGERSAMLTRCETTIKARLVAPSTYKRINYEIIERYLSEKVYREGKSVHVKEHNRKPPTKGKADIGKDAEAQKAFVRAFLDQGNEGIEALFTAAFIQLAELRTKT